jgi:multimeric flavodoxin WrbA
MHVLAFNGSARKTWNTATLLKKALEGAASQGATTELIHLYDVTFTGCKSCFACKTKGGKSYGRCATQDGLTPILARVVEADAIILGSPIYYGAVSGEMKSFLERLIFPYWTYTDPPQSLFPKRIPAGLIYTMNVTEGQMKEFGYGTQFAVNERMLRIVFGARESLCSCDTYQFDDYGNVMAPRFDPERKATRRAKVFPQECAKAYAMGVRFASNAGAKG